MTPPRTRTSEYRISIWRRAGVTFVLLSTLWLAGGTQAVVVAGSTGEADKATQAYCFRFHVTNVAEKRIAIEKPANYNRDDYRLSAGEIQGLEEIREVVRRSFPVQEFLPNQTWD